MDIKSLNYLLFIFIVILLYYTLGKVRNMQPIIICAANICFILFASGIVPLLMIGCMIIVTYSMAMLIESKHTTNSKHVSKAIMWFTVLLLIFILCFFKFYNEILDLINGILNSDITLEFIIVPIGVSYYTLTMIAYIIDVYHGKYAAERNFLYFFTFVSFFPSIVQGPVNLYPKTANQFKTSHEFNEHKFIMGLQRVLWGYFKKVVIADRIGVLVHKCINDESAAGFLLFWCMVLYSFQIYADFSGGIDVIMGVSEALGINLTENFKSPLISRSVTEYWQRWHRSLGDFMEKYIYYPIVLNRRVLKLSKKLRGKYLQKVFGTALASLIVFIIVGIWHGTGWNYVVYGCYQAFFVTCAVLFAPIYKKIKNLLHINETCLSWRVFQAIRTFLILVIGRCFIRARNMQDAIIILKKIFTQFSLRGIYVLFDGTLHNYRLDYRNLTVMYMGIVLLIVVDILKEKGINMRETLMKQDVVTRYCVYFATLFAIIILGIYGPEFVSSSFIYQGF